MKPSFSRASCLPHPPSSHGDYLNEADRQWADEQATPQPSGTLTQKLKVTGAYKSIPRKVLVVATRGNDSFGESARDHCTDASWTLRELACGHDVPIDMPDELAEVLLETACGSQQAQLGKDQVVNS
jgi:hypothetical protein